MTGVDPLADGLRQSEAGFTAAVIDLARYCGWRVLHLHDSRRQVSGGVLVGDLDARGWPDVFAVRGPRRLAAELKTGRRKVTAAQRAWLAALEEAGVEVHVWYPSMWDEIERTLRRENR
jgi:hypothetical protein